MSRTSVANNLLRRLLLGSVLAVGAAVAWFMSIGVVESILEQWIPREIVEQLAITRTGDVFIVRYGPGERTYRTLGGQTISDQAGMQEASTGSSSPHSRRTMSSDQYGWAARVIGFRDTRLPPTYWYMISDDRPGGRGYFAGFDSRSKQAVGYLGLAGFRAEIPPPSEQFAGDVAAAGGANTGRMGEEPVAMVIGSGIPYVFFVSDGSLYRFDLSQRSARKIELPVGEIKSVADLVELSKTDADIKEKQQLAVRTADSILVVNFEGELLRTIPLPAALRDEFLEIAYWSDGSSALALSDRKKGIGEIYFIDAQGQVARHETVPLLGQDLWQLLERWIWQTAVACPFPILLAYFLLVVFPRCLLLFGLAPTFAAAIRLCMSLAWLPTLLVCLLAVALVPVVLRRQRLFAERGTAGWILLVLLMGPAGLIGYWAHRHWPVLRRCGACGATIPSDRLECAVCEADMPLPALKGIEIVA